MLVKRAQAALQATSQEASEATEASEKEESAAKDYLLRLKTQWKRAEKAENQLKMA